MKTFELYLAEAKDPKREGFEEPIEYVKALWKYYNSKFFESKLKMPLIYFFKGDKQYGSWNTKEKAIKLDIRLMNNDKTLRDILIHEMCHQAAHEIDNFKSDENDGGHNLAWKMWMWRCGLSPDRYISVDQKTSILTKADKIKQAKKG